jgi:hypothetical protein
VLEMTRTRRPTACLTRVSFSLILAMTCDGVFGQEETGLRDTTARRLLEALQDRGMPDVSLWLLDRLARPDSGISADLVGELEYRRALALVTAGRAEPSMEKRLKTFERAQAAIDAFLSTPLPQTALPEGADDIDKLAGEIAALDREIRRINANIQQGKLRQERGRLQQAETARQAGVGTSGEITAGVSPAAAGIFRAAVMSFRAAERLITSSPIAGGDGDQSDADASDADEEGSLLDRVRKLLEQVDAAVGDRRPRAARSGRSRVEASRLLREWQAGLSERQDTLRNKLLEVRLLLGEAFFEVASALEVGTDEWRAAIEESIAVDEEMYEKYRTLLAGQVARVSQGRSEAAVARAIPVQAEAAAGESDRDRQFAKALATLADVRALSGGGTIEALRARAYNLSLECWLEMLPEDAYAGFDGLDEEGVRLAVAGGGPPESLNADWLGLKYRTALLLSRVVAASQTSPGPKNPLLNNAGRTIQQLATAVAKANREFASEARELLSSGADFSIAVSFASLMDRAGVAIATMQAATSDEEKTAARNEAVALIRQALPLAEDAETAELNRARYTLTFLYYDGGRLLDAAAMGEFLATWYPNAAGSLQAARIAMASLQRLSADPDPARAAEARNRCGTVAVQILENWPEDAATRDAAAIAISAAASLGVPDHIFSLVEKIPEHIRDADISLRAGIAAWKAIASLQSATGDERPSSDDLVRWQQEAATLLDSGLAAESDAEAGQPGQLAVAAALAVCQIAVNTGDLARATEVFEHPRYGPWTIVTTGSEPAGAAGSMAEDILRFGLSLYIQTEQIQKAEIAMTRLEAVATEPAQLTATYLRLGRELQAQLKQLASSSGDGRLDAESRQRATNILDGFERLLDAVASRASDMQARLWVATTYLELGSAGLGTGSASGIGLVVPQAKADSYLARAASSYEAVLKAGDEQTQRYEPSIRFKLAELYRAIGRFDEAVENIAWILSDPSRVNWVDGQFEAARILQQAGEAADDAAAANSLLTEAIAGRSDGSTVFWGWGGLASRLSRKAVVPADADEAARTASHQFFQARLELARCRKAIAGKSAAGRDEALLKAERDITVTYRLYPQLGGPEMRDAFDSLLKQIQKERGQPVEGLAAIKGV